MSYEKDEIMALPDKYKPLGAWEYFGYTILFSVPLIGIICLIVFALSSDNINRRNFARSYFCYVVIAFILVFLMIALILSGYGAFLEEFFEEFMRHPY